MAFTIIGPNECPSCRRALLLRYSEGGQYVGHYYIRASPFLTFYVFDAHSHLSYSVLTALAVISSMHSLRKMLNVLLKMVGSHQFSGSDVVTRLHPLLPTAQAALISESTTCVVTALAANPAAYFWEDV